MTEPELHIERITKTAPACESGRHLAHPFMECDEVDLLGARFTELYEQVMAEAYAEVLVHGDGTGELRGFLAGAERGPTPVERALAILDPHLRACPLYDAGPPVLYPDTWKA